MPKSSVEQPQVLTEAEASLRVLLLTELQAAFAALGVRCVLARRHRLVLRYDRAPCGPSGPVSPELHIFAGDRTGIATADGTTYRLAGGGQYPAGDPAGAASAVLAALRHANRLETR
jgi:hypothetical protein